MLFPLISFIPLRAGRSHEVRKLPGLQSGPQQGLTILLRCKRRSNEDSDHSYRAAEFSLTSSHSIILQASSPASSTSSTSSHPSSASTFKSSIHPPANHPPSMDPATNVGAAIPGLRSVFLCRISVVVSKVRTRTSLNTLRCPNILIQSCYGRWQLVPVVMKGRTLRFTRFTAILIFEC